ncbi:uncharacterized protein B0H64DRAFT_370563 [Chaetomium fimeti]|uniref:Uncharacterized protein n=1 Tax=Chaetomium fimeti TaxID=1854472 RepID=A0AAE0HRP9_9PEZI|nr:hypothetical protein B0H64DRAFT_370563 [Chaetomium fimeti]
MSSTRCLYLLALVALFAVAMQLPTRLVELMAAAGDVLFSLCVVVLIFFMSLPLWSRPPPVLLTVASSSMFWTVGILFAVIDSRFRNVGYLASFVDLHRNEGLRSRLEAEFIKLRNEFKKQQLVLASLSHDIAAVCKEHNNHCREFPTVFSRVFRPGMTAVSFQDAEWAEPYLVIKLYYHATDLKAVFLSCKVEELRSAVLINDDRIRQQSAALGEVQQAALDIVKRINKHRVKLHLEDVEAIRQLKDMKRNETRRLDAANLRPTWIEERIMNRWRDNLSVSEDFTRQTVCQTVYQPVFELPPQAAARQALEVENTPAVYLPVAVTVPAPGTGFEILFGCPQEALVPVSTPAPETDMVGVDTVMPDAPDLIEEPEDFSMMDVDETVEVAMDIDMANAPYEPLPCQGSLTLPAPPLLSTPVSVAFEDTAMEVERSRDIEVLMPVIVHQSPSPLASPFSSIPPAAAAAPAKVNAQVQPADSSSRPSDPSLLHINPCLFDATVEQLASIPKPEVPLAPSQPPQQQVGFPVCTLVEASVSTPVTVSLPAPETISFAFEAPGPCKTRRTAKPRPRPRRIQAQAPAAAPANAPAPDPPQVAQLPVAPAPIIAPQSSSSASDKGKGNASSTSAEAKPTHEFDSGMLPGEIVRSLCEDWIVACASFMEASASCGNLSPRWIRTWKQSTLISLGQELPADVDEAEIDQDSATSLVRRFFQFNLLRRMDGPGKDGKNAVLRNVKELAAKEGIDLGQVEI